MKVQTIKYSDKELLKKMDFIEYGWIDKNNKIYKDEDADKKNFENYKLQTPNEITKSKVGVCWDQVEFEREYLKNYSNLQSWFICYYINKDCPNHTFLTYMKNNSYYWFEHSWEKFRGIHRYKSLDSLLTDVRSKFIDFTLENKYIKDSLLIREYEKPEYGISVLEFYKHCEIKQAYCIRKGVV